MAVLNIEEMGQGRSAFYLAKWNSGLGGGAMLSFFLLGKIWGKGIWDFMALREVLC